METPKLSVAFIPRDKYSKSPDSLKSLLDELPVPSQVVIFDTGYPRHVMDQLLITVHKLRSQHIVEIVDVGKFINTNKLWNMFVEMAKSDRMMCLENDVVLISGCIDNILNALDSDMGDIIVPTVYEESFGNPHFNPSVSEIIRIKDGMLRSFLDRGRHDEVPLSDGRIIKHLERHCFFIKRSTAEILGKFDEEMHCRTDIDISLSAFKLDLSIYMPERCYVIFHSKPSATIDSEIFLKRWDAELVRLSQERLIEKHKLYRFKNSIDHVHKAVTSFNEGANNE